MAYVSLIDGIDDVVRSGQFFVTLTERLGDGKLDEGENALHLSRSLGITFPRELEGATIESIGERELVADRNSTIVAVTYPPRAGCMTGTTARAFSRCFKVCKKVSGATVCAQVCVKLDIGLGGISGDISATVSVKF